MRLTQAAKLQNATFGAGCFWGPELAFQRVPGEGDRGGQGATGGRAGGLWVLLVAELECARRWPCEGGYAASIVTAHQLSALTCPLVTGACWCCRASA